MPHQPPFDPTDYRVRPGQPVDLDAWPTRGEPAFAHKRAYHRALAANAERLSDLQERLYAHDRYALLLIFQAMDAAGKDGAIRHVMSGVNPQGCQVHSFQHPSATELDHDFLWRTHRALPERGRIGIFNRSYYEEVLIVRVQPQILAAQKLPAATLGERFPPAPQRFWRDRFTSIVQSEAHLHRNGTRIHKFFLHVSKEEQRQRLLDRIDDPAKNWKFADADLVQRRSWDAYMAAYADCLRATSTAESPWYVVPADDKWQARWIVSQLVVAALEELDPQYPATSDARRAELQRFRAELEE